MFLSKILIIYILLSVCSLSAAGQVILKIENIIKMKEHFSTSQLQQAQNAVDGIIEKISGNLKDQQKPFILMIRLSTRPEDLQKVLESYKRQSQLATNNPFNIAYFVKLHVNDNGICLYEAWKDFPSFIKHERHQVTLKHFTRTVDWLDKYKNLQIL